MLLTRAAVAKLSLPDGQSDIVYWDDDLRGFGVRIRAGGKKSWVVVYRNAEGVQRKMTLSEVPITSVDQARAAAERVLRSVGDSKDPHAEKLARRRSDKVEAITFGALVTTYLKEAKARLRPSSYDEVDRHLQKLWQPLHRHAASKIDRRMIGEELDKIAPERGMITANRARSSLSAMMAWAVERNKIESNPVMGVGKPLKSEPKRDRVLSDDELGEIWKHSGDGHFGDVIRLLILTAARREEVAAMCWSELDLARAQWTIPAARTKNKQQHIVPLPSLALRIIEGVERRDQRDLLFGEGDGPFSGWSKSKDRLDERIAKARLKAAQDAGLTPRAMPAWRVHDLRRSAATGMARLGIGIPTIERALNHISGTFGGIVAVYQRHDYAKEMRDAFDAWSAHVSTLTASAPSDD